MTQPKDDNSPKSEWQQVKEQNKAVNHSFLEDFKYRHKNPYHGELSQFEGFVLRDEEAEKYRSKWNTDLFQRKAPLHVEIGTGFGHFMLELCEQNPEINFVGLDYRFKRSFELARRLAKIEHKNFRYLRAKGERISFMFGEGEIDHLYYFFPDPWPKKRHHKKRLFQPHFLRSAHEALNTDGIFFIKTDHDDYFRWMLEVLDEQDFFSIELKTFDLHTEYPEHFLAKNVTKFEKIFMSQGTPTKALVLRKK